MRPSRAQVAYAAAIVAAVAVIACGFAWVLASHRMSPEDELTAYLRSGRYIQWGGNVAEVFSHRVDMVACSAVIAALALLLYVERQLRRGSVAWHGSWTMLAGMALTLETWIICVALDARWGEGTVILAIPIDFVLLVLLGPIALHLLLAGRAGPWLDGIVSLALAAGMFAAQLKFEPSSTGAPNGYVNHATLALALPLGLPLAVIWASYRRRLRERGLAWAGWGTALFFMINRASPKRVPRPEELLTIPGYRDGDVVALCRIVICDREPAPR